MTTLTNIPRIAAIAPAIQRPFSICLARVGQLVDRWVAATIARRAREVRLFGRAMPNHPALAECTSLNFAAPLQRTTSNRWAARSMKARLEAWASSSCTSSSDRPFCR